MFSLPIFNPKFTNFKDLVFFSLKFTNFEELWGRGGCFQNSKTRFSKLPTYSILFHSICSKTWLHKIALNLHQFTWSAENWDSKYHKIKSPNSCNSCILMCHKPSYFTVNSANETQTCPSLRSSNAKVWSRYGYNLHCTIINSQTMKLVSLVILIVSWASNCMSPVFDIAIQSCNTM